MAECQNFWQRFGFYSKNTTEGLCFTADQSSSKTANQPKVMYRSDIVNRDNKTAVSEHGSPNTKEEKTNARQSVPNDMEIRLSSIQGAGYGIFAIDKIPKGRVFGPYEGRRLQADSVEQGADASYMWEIVKNGIVSHIIDGKDEKHSNWMRFINCARIDREQNLEAYQFDNNIFYETYIDIDPGTELLVWYGDQYAANLGIKLSTKQIHSNTDSSEDSADSSDSSFSSTSDECHSSGDEWCPSQETIISQQVWHGFYPKVTRSYKVHQNTEEHRIFTEEQLPSKNKISKQHSHCVIVIDDSDSETDAARQPTQRSTCSASSQVNHHTNCMSLTDKKRDVIIINDSDDSGQDDEDMQANKKETSASKKLNKHSSAIDALKGTIDGTMKQHKKRQESMITCYLNGTKDLTQHKVDRLYICVKCEKCFSSKDDFKQHESEIHLKRKVIECSLCGALHHHKKVKTNKSDAYICRNCKKKQTTLVGIKQSSSRNNKIYQCELCSKTFGRVYSLKRHIHTHSSKQTFHHIDQQPSSGNELKQSYFETMSFKCCLCGQKYSQLQCLRGHKKIPQDALMFYCRSCQVELVPSEDLMI